VQLFFAKVLRSASEDEVSALFNKFGRVIEVNLFRAFQVSEWIPRNNFCKAVWGLSMQEQG
jgi:hypothetical protein